MVSAERELLLRPSNGDSTRKFVAAAALSVFIAMILIASTGRDESVELYQKRPLTTEEKNFVAHATSTPDKDLHRAPKLTSADGENDMNTFYDTLNQKTAAKDRKIVDKIKTLHKKESTISALHDINHYFDQMGQVKVRESKTNLQKEEGKGRQALNEVNQYFDQLDEQEKDQNEKDILNLGTGASVAEAAKRRVSALKAATASKSAAAAATKRKAAGGAAVQHAALVMREEDDKAARQEISNYFDSLDAQEAKVNKEDKERLSRGVAERRKHERKLDTQSGNADLNSYFDQLTKQVRALDRKDKARLRRDSDPVNAGDGVRVAFKAAAKSRLQARNAGPRTFH